MASPLGFEIVRLFFILRRQRSREAFDPAPFFLARRQLADEVAIANAHIEDTFMWPAGGTQQVVDDRELEYLANIGCLFDRRNIVRCRRESFGHHVCEVSPRRADWKRSFRQGETGRAGEAALHGNHPIEMNDRSIRSLTYPQNASGTPGLAV